MCARTRTYVCVCAGGSPATRLSGERACGSDSRGCKRDVVGSEPRAVRRGSLKLVTKGLAAERPPCLLPRPATCTTPSLSAGGKLLPSPEVLLLESLSSFLSSPVSPSPRGALAPMLTPCSVLQVQKQPARVLPQPNAAALGLGAKRTRITSACTCSGKRQLYQVLRGLSSELRNPRSDLLSSKRLWAFSTLPTPGPCFICPWAGACVLLTAGDLCPPTARPPTSSLFLSTRSLELQKLRPV